MNPHKLRLYALTLGLLVGACDGMGQGKAADDTSPGSDEGSDGPDMVDPGAPDAGPPAEPGAIPLADWVDHLVDDYPETAQPDTVHDKVIEDTDDPDAFNAYLIEK